MSIVIKRVRDQYGTELTGTCLCGAELDHYVERGAQVSDCPGPFPDDIECEECGRWYNGSGQEIRPRGDYDHSIDRWDDD